MIPVTPRRSKRTASKQGSPSIAGVTLPPVQVKQSFAYGSPGVPVMPKKIEMPNPLDSAIESIEAAVEVAKARDQAAGISPLEAFVDAPKVRKPRLPRALSPVVESPIRVIPVEPQRRGSFFRDRSFFGDRNFFGEGGVFQGALFWTWKLIKRTFWALVYLIKILLLLGLVLSPLWAGWFYGPSLLRKIDTSGVTSRFSWPSRSADQTVKHTVPEVADNYVSSLVTRVSDLEQRIRELKKGVAQQTLMPDKPIHRVNYFSTGLGAVIDPYLTSPTKLRQTTFLQRAYIGVMRIRLRKPLPPVAALEPWDDIGDCWCASHGIGKSQLAVLLPRAIYPEAITVEHIPSGATLDIASAPRDMELWVEVLDDAARELIGDAAFPLLNTQDDNYISLKSIHRNYVRVGAWRYSIHDPNHIQTATMAVDLQHFKTKINKVIVRTVSNWGEADYTCLYRLRLHGTLADGEKVSIPFPLDHE